MVKLKMTFSKIAWSCLEGSTCIYYFSDVYYHSPVKILKF